MYETGTTGLPVKSLGRSLNRQVFLLSLIGVMGLASAIVLGFWVTLDQVQARMDRINIATGAVFDRFFLDIQRDLQVTSAGMAARADLNSALLELRMRNNAFLDVLFINPEGIILAQRNAVGRPKQTKIDRQEWLKTPPPFGQVVIGPVGYEAQTPYVDMAISATDDSGLPAGLLLARVDLTALWNATLDIKAGDTGYVYIADSAGQLVAFRHRRFLETASNLEKLVGHTPQAIAASRLSFYIGLSGEPVLASAQSLKTAPWFAVVEQPAWEAMTPFVIPALILLMAFIGVGFLFFNIIRFMRVRIVLPLWALRDAVAQMANGQLKQGIIIRHNDELGQLADSFNCMAHQLQHTFAELESQVDALQQAQAALRAKSEELDHYFTSSLDLLCIADTDGYFHRLNPEWEKTLGYSLAALEGKRFLDLVHPDDLATTLAAVSQLDQQKAVLIFENRYRCKDGSYRWIEWRSFPVGNLIYAAARDITARKQVEDALRRSENLYRKMIENSPLGMHFYKLNADDQLIFVGANPAADKLLGVDNSQFIGKTIGAAFPPLIQTEVPERYHDVAARGILWSTQQIIYEDNNQIKGVFEVTAFQTMPGNMVAIFSDITERKQAEDALRESQERLSSFMDSASDSFYLFDSDLRFVEINQKGLKIAGMKKEEIIGKSITEIFPDVVASGRYEQHKEVIQTGKPFELEDFIHHPVFGDLRFILKLFKVGNGLGVIAADITERKRAEVALEENRYFLDKILNTSPDLIYIYDLIEQRNVYANRETLEFLGYDQEMIEVEGASIMANISHPDDQAAIAEHHGRFATANDSDVLELDYRLKDPQGNWRWVRSRDVLFIRDPQGRARQIIGIAEDITERKRAEDALRESEEKFAKVFRDAPLLIAITDMSDATYVDVNEYALQISGFARAEVIGHTAAEIGWLRDEDRARLVREIQDHGEIIGMEMTFHAKDGRKIDGWINGELMMIAGRPCLLTLTVDVTERKRAEDALSESRARLLESQRVAHLGYYVFDIVAGFWTSSETLDEVFGIDVDYQRDVAGWLAIVHPEQRDEMFAYLTQHVLSEHQLFDKEYRIMRVKDQETRWVHGMGNLESSPDGNPIRMFGTIQDITQSKQAEAKLSQQLDQLQLLRVIDAAIISSVDLDANLRLIAQKTVGQFEIDAAAILLLNPKTHALDFAAGEGFHTDALQAHPEIGERIAHRALQELRAIHIPDLRQLAAGPALTKAIRNEGFVAYYGIPLIAKNQLLGILDVFNRSPFPADPDWLSFIETLAGQVSISIDNATLFSDLQKSNTELMLAYDATLEGWSFALDLRDKETEGHARRVTEMAIKLARVMGFSEDEVLQVKRGALLHDIGKMGVPDAILLKPGKLTDQEWRVMRKHPTYARDLLAHIAYLKLALDIPYSHHEKWDGTGYPQGLKGEQIPLAARLFAMVDVWDALSHDRPYRPSWPPEKVAEYIRSQASTHFDPQVVEIFLYLLNAEDAP